MKKLFYLLPLLLAGVVQSHGQGYVLFASVTQELDVEVRIADEVTGYYLDSAYVAQLYAGTEGTPQGSLVALDTPVHFIDSPPEFLGEFLGNEVQVPNVPIGEIATLQVRVWAAVYDTWEDAYAAALLDTDVHIGTSTVFDVVTGSSGFATEIAWTLQPFVIAPIPEPGVMALGFLGVGLVLFRRHSRAR